MARGILGQRRELKNQWNVMGKALQGVIAALQHHLLRPGVFSDCLLRLGGLLPPLLSAPGRCLENSLPGTNLLTTK